MYEADCAVQENKRETYTIAPREEWAGRAYTDETAPCTSTTPAPTRPTPRACAGSTPSSPLLFSHRPAHQEMPAPQTTYNGAGQQTVELVSPFGPRQLPLVEVATRLPASPEEEFALLPPGIVVHPKLDAHLPALSLVATILYVNTMHRSNDRGDKMEEEQACWSLAGVVGRLSERKSTYKSVAVVGPIFLLLQSVLSAQR